MSNERKTVINRITLRNFRKFEQMSLDLDEKLTLLVAENGGGKTAILDGIAMAFIPLINQLWGTAHSGFSLTDVRLSRTPDGAMEHRFPVACEAVGTIDGEPSTWVRQLDSSGGRTTSAQAKSLTETANRLRAELGDYADGKQEAPPLPVIAYYGTGRLWSEHKLTKGKAKEARDLTTRTGAYRDCLSTSSSYGQFVVWFESLIRESQSEIANSMLSLHKPQEKLAAVRQATDTVLQPSGWAGLDWDFLSNVVVANHREFGRLAVSQLSDGIRNLVAMVADLALRSVRLNPHFGADACQKSPGIVMIDEVDMHLHPAWQQTVVGSLRKAFPNFQFVLTSHSPQVISTVPRECIRVLRGDEWCMPSGQTRGVESALLLAEVMGVSSIPEVPESEWVSEYMGMIDLGQSDTEEAAALRIKIVAHFGEQHPVVLDCDRLRRWQAFKHRGSSAAEG